MTANESQFQSLGNGAYRVNGARVSPSTGRYVTRNAEAGRAIAPKGGTTGSGSSKSTQKK